MKSETPAQRYRREAEECERNAEKSMNGADREAWSRLADDWTRLALGAELHPNLGRRPGSSPLAHLE